MISNEKMKTALAKYKEVFRERWTDEKFKWEAVKWFQDHWDIHVDKFGAMFAEATEKTSVLLASMNNFPRKMMIQYAEDDEEAARAMFIRLYDESRDVTDRVLQFQSQAQELCDRLSPGYQHYQRPMAISVYLWLKYPDKYDVYKFSVCKAAGVYLENDFKPVKGHTVQNMRENARLIDAIQHAVNEDEELISMFEACMDEACYRDESHRILAFDVSFFIANYLANGEAKKQEWTGADYHSGIATEMWDELAQARRDVDFSDTDLYVGQPEGDRGYWWLNANPRIWSFADMDVGGEQSYTMYNDNGNKRRVFQNFLDAKAGDLVIGYESNPVKQIVALCRVARENDGENLYFEKLEEFANPVDYAALRNAPELAGMEYFVNPQGSLFKLTKSEYDFIMGIIREKNQENPAESRRIDTYRKADFLSEVYMTSEKYDSLKGLLFNKKNVILQGAPGVGKTFAATRLAYSIMGVRDDTRVRLIQFHQNYSYEDFIMGYKPKGAGFELQSGVFYTFCQEAAENQEQPYFFLIDEINRGNMTKIFGELLMLIEKDYRGKELMLACNGLPFSVPENVYIIGMMNTADRSLALIDYALRRRFSFFAMEPGFRSDGFKAYIKSLDNDTFEVLIEKVGELNAEIARDPSLGNGFCIGHSYFCGQDVCSDEWMQSVVEYDLLPMLEEYWFDEPAQLQKWKNILRGVFDDE